MKIGRLALRTVVGGLFVGHGTQKLFGWFDGHGLDATAQGFDAMGLRPGRTNAIIAGASEAAGGAALAAGYQTPLAAAPIVGAMLMAIKRVHAKNGLWSQNGGCEYNVVLVAATLALVEAGPGPLALDGLRGKEKQGTLWALVTLGLAVGGVAAVERVAARQAPAVTEAETPAAPAPAQPASAQPAPADPAPAAPAEPSDAQPAAAEPAPVEPSDARAVAAEPAPAEPAAADESPAEAAGRDGDDDSDRGDRSTS